MDFDFSKLVKNVSEIRLKGGIFKTASLAIVITVICITAMAISSGVVWLICLSILLVAGLVTFILWRLLDFAHKNPQAAIMEGAEFLLYEQSQLAAKGDKIIESTLDGVERLPLVEDEELKKQVLLPDNEAE